MLQTLVHALWMLLKVGSISELALALAGSLWFYVKASLNLYALVILSSKVAVLSMCQHLETALVI